MPATVEDLIDELENWLDEANEIEGTHPPPAGISSGDLATLAGYLDSTEQNIDIIIDPGQQPNLNPSNAGSIDTSVTPSTISEYATDCYTLAAAAKTEVHKQNRNDQVIGAKLKTIKSLLPGYRDAAGIT